MSKDTGSASADFYRWEAERIPFTIYLALDVVDKLGSAVMRGFSAVPRRGVEVGGILLGRAQAGSAAEVWVEDFRQVPCSYSNGPSYLLNAEEAEIFRSTLAQLRRAGAGLVPVGLFRSNTREEMVLSPEDLGVLENEFPEPHAVALLIRPFASRVSEAGFFFRENGRFQQRCDRQIPFRRKELRGGKTSKRPDAPAQVSLDFAPPEEHEKPASPAEPASPPEPLSPELPDVAAEAGQPWQVEVAESPAAIEPDAPEIPNKRRKPWSWIPLSFLFLLLGVFIGFEVALTFGGGATASVQKPYALGLSAEKFGDSLHVKWDRTAMPIRTSSRGVLSIDDGGNARQVPLDAHQLRTGSVVYRYLTPKVRLELRVYPRDRVNLTETLDVDVPATPGTGK